MLPYVLDMELRHLRYFVAVAEARHFTRAAQHLGIGQPPLSQQIRALEAELGTPLFERLPRGVALTAAGAVFFDDARQILAAAEQARARALRAAQGELGRIRIGMINSAPFHPFVPRVIREFGRRYPDVALSLDENSTPRLAEALLDGRADVAFVRPPLGDHPRLEALPLFDEAMLVALPLGHPLARFSSLSLWSLAAEGFVLFPREVGAGLHDEIVASCRRAGFSPRVVQETSQVTSIVNLVAAGLGVSLVPASMQRINSEGIAYRPIAGEAPRARMVLLHRRDDDSPTVARLIALTRSGGSRGDATDDDA